MDGDGLPKYTCRTCWLKVKNLHSKTDDFKRLCKESEEKFKQQERFKRCRKDGEPNDAASQLPKKTRSARIFIDEQFTHESNLVKIAPKPSKDSSKTSSLMHMDYLPSISSRVLPPIFNKSVKNNDDGFRILSCSGLANNEVFRVNYEHFTH